jgi:DNA-binding MarR family transcriptional regulator
MISILRVADQREPERRGEPEENAGFLLWRLTLAWRAHAGAALHSLELTHTQYVVLALLFWHYRSGISPTQRELADRGGLDQMLVSKTVRGLNEAGLVITMSDPADGRATRMALTDHGQTTFLRAATVIGEAHQQFLAPLGDRAGAFIQDLQQLLPSTTRAPRRRKRPGERTSI